MNPGSKYKLTLQNTAADSSLYTNIHTHGLHISGSGDADDVTRKVAGGSCLDYTWDIPADHPSGTYWYHPHYHTATNVQTSGGAFGMIIIEETSNSLNAWAKDAANELVLLVSDAGSLLGNGNANEVLQLEAENWYRLRVSVVTPGARASNLSFNGGSCTIHKVASDGVWHNMPFTTYTGSTFEMTGASRADFAIKCSSGSTTSINWGQGTAATLQAGSFGSGTGQSSNDLGSAPPAPASLDWSNPSTPCASCSYDVALSGAQINGASWDEFNPLEIIDYGNVYEWTISGSGECINLSLPRTTDMHSTRRD
jgi:FtsP/CotA-like multicopper oxidase with cupredoxin domain